MHKIAGKVIGRAYRAKKASDEAKAKCLAEEARKKLITQQVYETKNFATKIIDLKEHMKIIQETDLKDPSNVFLFSNDIYKSFDLGDINQYSQKTLNKFTWIDYDGYELTIIPLSDKLRSKRLAVKILVKCTSPKFNTAILTLYADWNKEGISIAFTPTLADFKLVNHHLHSFDGFVDNDGEDHQGVPIDDNIEKNFFLCIAQISANPSGIEGIPNTKIKVTYEHELQPVSDYTELQESKYLNLIESKHVHPKDVKAITSKLYLGTAQFKMSEILKALVFWPLALFIFFGGLLGLSIAALFSPIGVA